MLKGKLLDIFFRQIAPEKLIACIRGVFLGPTWQEYRSWFLDVAEMDLSGYSLDEKELLFRKSMPMPDGYSGAEWRSPPPFTLLAEFGDEVLERRGEDICCKFRRTLDWRAAYLNMGQDLIVTAWLAKQAVASPGGPNRFSWPAVIPTDNRNFNSIFLKDGISENHYHLFGSAAVFPLNWSRLMTWPDVGQKSVSWLEDSLQPRAARGRKDNRVSPRKRLLYAALIRSLLFRRLKGDREINCRMRLREFEENSDADGSGQAKLRLLAELDVLRLQSLWFPQPKDSSFPADTRRGSCLDYAFTEELSAELNRPSRIFAAERLFLFRCFHACFSGKAALEDQWVFYLYLLLKGDLRQELIQVNQETGFRNFQNYERRKYKLWHVPEAGDGYWNEAYRTAIVAPLEEQPIRSLELRITPGACAEETMRRVREADLSASFAGQPDYPAAGSDWDEAPPKKYKTFFVLHFIKEKDEPERVPIFSCRHEEFRDSLGRQSREIVKALALHPYLRRRVLGIDACSNEIGCRPEVFATAFRFLQDCPTWLYSRSARWRSGAQPRLSLGVTYHAGEDFLDIADGLRAIDEAVCFLNMRRGHRIGHALALGVEPASHYEKKHGCVVLSKQDLLDNLVWLYFRSGELNITISPTLRERIQNRAESLLTEIYRNRLPEYITLLDYYQSWLLRGDAPRCYRQSGLLDPVGRENVGDFAPYLLNRWTEKRGDLESCHRNTISARLYFCYHYSKAVKEAGAAPIFFPIQKEYMSLMEQMQRGMQRYMDSLGLGIECNPSSNVLIGTFGGYLHHPVFMFNTEGLSRRSDAVQMHVSINTDDQGVFDTSLSFEYAVIAASMTGAEDCEGRRLYSDREIEQYIRNLQRMGNEQSFLEI